MGDKNPKKAPKKKGGEKATAQSATAKKKQLNTLFTKRYCKELKNSFELDSKEFFINLLAD